MPALSGSQTFRISGMTELAPAVLRTVTVNLTPSRSYQLSGVSSRKPWAKLFQVL